MDIAESAQKQLAYGLGEIFTQEAYPRFLSYSSRFLSFSWQNIVLMYLQDPEAACVAGPAAWKAASGYSILPDAPPILVLYPQYDPEARSFSWSVRKVFDIRRLPGPADQAGYVLNHQPLTTSQAFADIKKAFRRETGMSVYPSDGSSNELEIAGRTVLVPQSASDREKVVLLFEYLLSSYVSQDDEPIVKGCIGNSVKYILYRFYGFEDVKRIVFPYVSLPALDSDRRMQILKRTFRIISRLIGTG